MAAAPGEQISRRFGAGVKQRCEEVLRWNSVPDEADDLEALQQVGMRQALAVEPRVRLGQFVGQPVAAGLQSGAGATAPLWG
jgi:hypothetical protein